ncbi:hypothetical protein NKH73_12845 [Mesorhizobium sp. M0938]|uniref:DUF6422 family protein n=1 Tax=unclassified Mesorhizobium TaxID=325217 RepID=UPI003334BDB4
MFKHLTREDLTTEQSEVLEKAAFMIISARKEAAAMLVRAGLELEDGGFGNPCHAHIEGHGNCGCRDYTGDGGTCLTRITVDVAFPPSRSCGHPPSKHLST